MLSVSIGTGAGFTAGAIAAVSLSVFDTGSLLRPLHSAAGAGLATVAVLTLLCLSLLPVKGSVLTAGAEVELASLVIAGSVAVCTSLLFSFGA